MDKIDIIPAIEAILFASGDPVPAQRIALVLDLDISEVFAFAETLKQELEENGRGVRLVRLGDKLQLCSNPIYSQMIVRALEQRKPPKLSQSALEVLAIVAYFQPVTRAYVDQMRGMDSSYTVGILNDRGLIEPCGKLDAPGRPTLFRTTDAFLRVMGISDLSDLPQVSDITSDEGIVALQNTIDDLKRTQIDGQIGIDDVQ